MIDFDAILKKHNEVRRKEEALIRIRARATDTSVHLSDMPSGGGDGKRMENDTINIVMAQDAYVKARIELKAMLKELRKAMSCLQKWQHKDAIKYRYLEGRNLSEVMRLMGYEWTQTNRYIAEGKAIINSSPDEKMV